MTSKRNTRIGIIGLGLIGGSLAAALRKYLGEVEIVGMDIDSNVREIARQQNLIDRIEYTLSNIINSIDILILASPVSDNLYYIKQLHTYSKELTVTDVSSVKVTICSAADTLSDEIIFVGGHPMAGKEKGGIENISPDLFHNAPYVLCPPRTGKIPDILINIIQVIGSRIILLSPEFHDRYIASISHLPQLLAVGLLSDTAEMDHETKEVILEIAGMGFQDMTRIGESPFGIWKDILTENRENTLDSLNSLIRKLVLYRSFLQKGEIDLFKGEFEKAREFRESLKK